MAEACEKVRPLTPNMIVNSLEDHARKFDILEEELRKIKMELEKVLRRNDDLESEVRQLREKVSENDNEEDEVCKKKLHHNSVKSLFRRKTSKPDLNIGLPNDVTHKVHVDTLHINDMKVVELMGILGNSKDVAANGIVTGRSNSRPSTVKSSPEASSGAAQAVSLEYKSHTEPCPSLDPPPRPPRAFRPAPKRDSTKRFQDMEDVDEDGNLHIIDGRP